MKILKLILGALLIIAVLIFVVANYSEKTSTYKCNVIYSTKNKELPTSLYMKINVYRWWVALWSSKGKDANIWIEAPSIAFNVYHHVTHSGDLFLIYKSTGESVGTFSTLSNNLSLEYGRGLFKGECSLVQR